MCHIHRLTPVSKVNQTTTLTSNPLTITPTPHTQPANRLTKSKAKPPPINIKPTSAPPKTGSNSALTSARIGNRPVRPPSVRDVSNTGANVSRGLELRVKVGRLVMLPL